MRTRSRSPPRLRRGFIRSVWLLKPTIPSAGAGAAAQLPTQCLVPCIELSSLQVFGAIVRRDRLGCNDFDCENPSLASREREGPAPKAWEGEGLCRRTTLTRLRAAPSGTLSRGAGEGQRCGSLCAKC